MAYGEMEWKTNKKNYKGTYFERWESRCQELKDEGHSIQYRKD